MSPLYRRAILSGCFLLVLIAYSWMAKIPSRPDHLEDFVFSSLGILLSAMMFTKFLSERLPKAPKGTP